MKIVCVLYPGGEAARNPDLLGCAENALGLRPFLEGEGHELVALTDKEEALDRELADADVLVTTPFWPAYVTRERIQGAHKLKLMLTAGVGSDHVDLAAAAERFRHRVADYAVWREAYDGFDTERRTLGVTGDGVHQAVGDENDVTVWHDFPDPGGGRVVRVSLEVARRDAAGRRAGPARSLAHDRCLSVQANSSTERRFRG